MARQARRAPDGYRESARGIHSPVFHRVPVPISRDCAHGASADISSATGAFFFPTFSVSFFLSSSVEAFPTCRPFVSLGVRFRGDFYARTAWNRAVGMTSSQLA